MHALAERLDALDRALDEGDLDSVKRLLAEFRPKEQELLVPYVKCKLVGDEGGAARWRQQLDDCLTLERGDEDEVRGVERRTGRRIIARVPAPPATTPPPPPVDRAQCVQAVRPRERRGRHGSRRRTNSRQAARDGPSDLDPPPRSPLPEGVAATRAFPKTARALIGGPCLALFPRSRPWRRPEKGERR
jgi:hypothetical protein